MRIFTAMRALVWIALILILMTGSGRAETADALLEGLDLSEIARWAKDGSPDVDVSEMVGRIAAGEAEWDFESLLTRAKTVLLSSWKEAGKCAALLSGLVALGVVLKGVFSGRKSLMLICTLSVGMTLVSVLAQSLKSAGTIIERIGKLCQAVYPVLGGLMTVGGKGASQALFTPVASVAGVLLSRGIGIWVLGLIRIAAALTLAGNLPGGLNLGGMSSLVRRACTFLLGGMTSIFAAILSIQGILAHGYDGASIQAARFAVGTLVPVVGKDVSDSLDAVVKSAVVVKNAVGTGGLVLMALSCFRPIAELILKTLAVRFASALSEIGDLKDTGKMLKDFSETLSLLTAAAVVGAVLFVMMVGAALTLFSGGI